MPSCTSCSKIGINCVRALQVRFRNGLDTNDENYTFSDNQVWLQPERGREWFVIADGTVADWFAVEYRDETAQLSQIYKTVLEDE